MAMVTSFLLLAICLIFPSFIASTRSLQDPELVVQEVNRDLNDSRRKLSYLSCGTGNKIDDCWMCSSNKDPQQLAECSRGFGKDAVGGKDGKSYVVTDSRDPDPVNVVEGTLRYAVIQKEPLWITFAKDMTIVLKQELIFNSHKTVDGRGHKITITGFCGLTIQYVSNVIIHNIEVTGMKPGGNANVRDSPDHYGHRGICDGDAISIFGSHDVWVDHCTLSKCADGLVDVVMASTGITISNNYFHDHNEVMLLGHSDQNAEDKNMQVTVAYNHFGKNLTQRMPRCRLGYFEVLNNLYSDGWGIYAVGGSASPKIVSKGNKFVASNDPYTKQVTFHEAESKNVWEKYSWSSENDLMINGAYFTQSGETLPVVSMSAKSPDQVDAMTANAGAI